MKYVQDCEDQETYCFHDTTSSDLANLYRYRVRSPLIEACIEGGTINNTEIISFTLQNERYNFTRYYLTSLIKFAFNIQRRLGYEETYYMPIEYGGNINRRKYFENTLELANSISDEMFYEAVKEIQNIYEHTQYMLKTCNLIEEGGFVRVYRSLNAIELAQALRQIEIGGLNNPDFSFKIDTNILLSGECFHDKLDIAYSHKLIKVCFKVPVEDIIIHPNFILTKHAKTSFQANSLKYENEILFVNRHPRGKMTFKNRDIYNIDKEACYKSIENLNQNQGNSDITTKQYTSHYRYVNDATYYLMMDAQFLILNSQLQDTLTRLKPRLRKKVIKNLNEWDTQF
ncbi:hypothetical protein SAMN04488168_1756 [Bacillus sp. 491mf]|uniref:hypothetical protein n=1 Tax=Bacillus TaxID=1386 RepID=UPI00055487A6|nr:MULTISPECIES: hypothetical protein [unclassified Bacillus (in: firmicutes)]SFD69006.1 hypothetical protein SAMN04488168_1756 [Bacillus sp. 491mf]